MPDNPVAPSLGARDARSFDIFNVPDGYFGDPYRWLRALRIHDPLHINSDGSILLTRYDDVRAIWRDQTAVVDKTELFRRAFGEGPLFEHHTTSMLFRDPPAHDRLRAILNPFFTPSSLERLRTHVEHLVDRLLGRVADKRDVEFVSDFALQIPTTVMCRMLGVPEDDGTYIQNLSHKILIPLNPLVSPGEIEAGHAAAAEFKDYLGKRIVRIGKRSADGPAENMIDAMLRARDDGARMTDDEVLHSAIQMFNGGHSTTTHLIALTVHYLLEFPDQLKRLREEPGILASAIEECIRYASPSQLQARRTTRPLRLQSGDLRSDCEIIICQASANHDETKFDHPELLDLGRANNDHLAFGSGIHFCIGRALARLEMNVTIPRLLARFSHIERTAAAVYSKTPRFRSLASLPLRLSS